MTAPEQFSGESADLVERLREEAKYHPMGGELFDEAAAALEAAEKPSHWEFIARALAVERDAALKRVAATEAQRAEYGRVNSRLHERVAELKEALEAIADSDYEGRKLWEHKLAARALSPQDSEKVKRLENILWPSSARVTCEDCEGRGCFLDALDCPKCEGRGYIVVDVSPQGSEEESDFGPDEDPAWSDPWK